MTTPFHYLEGYQEEYHEEKIIINNNRNQTVTYDDILKSLNMKVSEGRLEYINHLQKQIEKQTNTQSNIKVCNYSDPQKETKEIYPKVIQTTPHVPPKKPLTREEYQKILLQREYIKQIKPKKMSFF
jgi:hypothetical protein